MPTLDGIIGGRSNSSSSSRVGGESSSTNNSGGGGVGRPTLSSIRQASSQALSKAQLMVGLKSASDMEEGQSQSSGAGNDGGSNSERSSFIDEAADLLCPELTFQQVRPDRG